MRGKKKLGSLKLVAVLCLLLSIFTGCTEKTQNVEIDIGEKAQALLDNISFKDDLTLAESSVAVALYGLDESWLSGDGVLYVSTGATAEEIALFQATDEENAKKIESQAKQRLEDQKTSFKSYNPDEMTKLEDAVLVRQGVYVMLCVSDDSAKAKEILG